MLAVALHMTEVTLHNRYQLGMQNLSLIWRFLKYALEYELNENAVLLKMTLMLTMGLMPYNAKLFLARLELIFSYLLRESAQINKVNCLSCQRKHYIETYKLLHLSYSYISVIMYKLWLYVCLQLLLHSA